MAKKVKKFTSKKSAEQFAKIVDGQIEEKNKHFIVNGRVQGVFHVQYESRVRTEPRIHKPKWMKKMDSGVYDFNHPINDGCWHTADDL